MENILVNIMILIFQIIQYLNKFLISTFCNLETTKKKYQHIVRIRKTCKVPDKKYALENIISIDYGQNVINNKTYPFKRFG